MFMGTDAVPDIDILLESGGGSNNASTREEVTNYYTVAPENMLEMVLYIEADRFAHLDRAMTQEKLDKQRDVVLNERRQSYENQPYVVGNARGDVSGGASVCAFGDRFGGGFEGGDGR